MQKQNRKNHENETDANAASRVLLVDDYETNRMFAGMLFEQYDGIKCDTASNGEEALAMIRDNRYDLVLMDINMPVLDGIEATRRLRSEFKSDVPVIALTADSDEASLSRFQANGINGHLSKPFDLDALESLLERFNLLRRPPESGTGV